MYGGGGVGRWRTVVCGARYVVGERVGAGVGRWVRR